VIHRFTPKAAAELRTAIRAYERERAGLGRAFNLEVKTLLDHITAFPEGSRDIGDGIRRRCLKQFPFGLFYSIEETEIVIVAVSHLHRRPDHWRDRL
jgi:hypothetical protein